MILKPLEPFRDYMTIVSRTDCAPRDAITAEEVGADHFRSSAVYLTAAHPSRHWAQTFTTARRSTRFTRRSLDKTRRLPSIQLCIENVDASGSCGYNYSCVYMDTISWSSPTTPLPMTLNPRVAFEDLFGDGGSPEDRATRRKANNSILDGITHDVSRIQKDLDGKDRSRLNTYLENVREIERRIQAIEAYNASNPKRELPSAPIGVPDSWEEHVKLMFDLAGAGFAAEVTRISTLKLSRDTSNRVFPESGNHDAVPLRIAPRRNAVRGIVDLRQNQSYHISLLPTSSKS